MTDFLNQHINGANLDSLYSWLITSGLRIFLIILGALILLKVSQRVINKIASMLSKEGHELVSAQEKEKRIVTITNLLSGVATISILLVSLMMILKEIGMEIAPIIAGAGIIGLAVGFGAQNLVKDIISGFFILVENQIRVGDVAVINGTAGLVEEINLRTIVLRDLEGTMHVFPNGTIESLANKSKGWSRYVIDVGVAYKEDVDNVMKTLEEIGNSMMHDIVFRDLILEPLEILGVDNFGSSEIVIKCMIKTQPLKQWDVGRELRRRIKIKFDEEGIEIPFPHLSLYFGEASSPIKLVDTA